MEHSLKDSEPQQQPGQQKYGSVSAKLMRLRFRTELTARLTDESDPWLIEERRERELFEHDTR
jgi:hypothetical protein